MESAQQHILAAQASLEMALPLAFADATTPNQAHSVFSRTKCPYKWFFCWDFRILRHGIGPQRTLASQASVEMALPLAFADAMTRNQAHSVLSRTKRPWKWLFCWDFRTLRHVIGSTAYSRVPSVRGNGSSAGFCGHYDTESAQQHILADQASLEMVLPLAFADTTTRNRLNSVLSPTKRPRKWPVPLF